MRGAAGTEAISYLYDGDQIIAEYDGSGNLITKYVYGTGIDEPIRMHVIASPQAEAIYYYHFDGLGSVTHLTNETGSTSETYTYDAFGKPKTVSTLGNRFMFTGREYDAETGLYYYRARHYSPSIGRFLQKDPLEIDDENTYTYCYNDPVNYADPYGLQGVVYDPQKWQPSGYSVLPSANSTRLRGQEVIPPIGDRGLGRSTTTLPRQNTSHNPKLIKELPATQAQGVSENVTRYAVEVEKDNKKDKKRDKKKKAERDIRKDKPPSDPHYDKKTKKYEKEHWHYRDYNWDPNEEIWKPGKWRYGGPGKTPSN